MSVNAAQSVRNHWRLFVIEGLALVVLGLIAILVPSIARENVTIVLAWLFLISGTVGLATTYSARQASGFLAVARIGRTRDFDLVVLISNKSRDLHGGLMGWPLTMLAPCIWYLCRSFSSKAACP